MDQQQLSGHDRTVIDNLATKVAEGLQELWEAKSCTTLRQFQRRAADSSGSIYNLEWGTDDSPLYRLVLSAGLMFDRLAMDGEFPGSWIMDMRQEEFTRAFLGHLSRPEYSQMVTLIVGKGRGVGSEFTDMVRAGAIIADLAELDPEFAVAGPGLIAQKNRLPARFDPEAIELVKRVIVRGLASNETLTTT